MGRFDNESQVFVCEHVSDKVDGMAKRMRKQLEEEKLKPETEEEESLRQKLTQSSISDG